MSDSVCRLGIVGLGAWTRRAYLPNIALMDDVALVAASTRSEANRAACEQWLGGTTDVVPHWQSLLGRPDLDGLIVATAPEAHRAPTEAALARDLPVLCEKPLAVTLEDCDLVLAAERASKAFLQVGFEFRHAPVIRQALDWIDEGRLGRITQVWCRVFRDKRDAPAKQPKRWSENGGVFVEFLCHYFDLLNGLSGGAPERVSGVAGQHLGAGAWDHGWINVEYSNGALGHLGYSVLCPLSSERWELGVAGERGVLDIGLNEGTLRLACHDEAPVDWHAPPIDHPNKPYPGSYEQIRNFVECIRSGQRSPVDGTVGKHMLGVGYGADKAVATGQPVELD